MIEINDEQIAAVDRKIANGYVMTRHDLDVAQASLRELQRLRASLPRTADGAEINIFENTPVPYVWIIDHRNGNPMKVVVVGWHIGMWEDPPILIVCESDESADDFEIGYSECYSTREAAQNAARSAREKADRDAEQQPPEPPDEPWLSAWREKHPAWSTCECHAKEREEFKAQFEAAVAAAEARKAGA